MTMTDQDLRASQTCLEALQDLRQLWLNAVARYQKADNFIHTQIDSLMSLQVTCDTEIEERIRVQNELEAANKRNLGLQAQLKAVQKEAQVTFDVFSQKQIEDQAKIQFQINKYNELYQKYAALKASLDTTADNVSVPQSEIIIDTDKAKARLVELAEQGLNAGEIRQRLSDEGYRTKGRSDGKVKAYLNHNINKWWTQWKETGSL